MGDLSLKGIIDVTVQLSPTVSYQRGFNTALILGPFSEAANMPDADVDGIAYYETLVELVEDFANTTSVYKAAVLYFGQSSIPKGVFVGCISTALETAVEAITRLRGLNSEWYVAIPTDSVMADQTDEELSAISTYIETAVPSTIVAYSLSASATYLATLEALKTAGFMRTITMYDDAVINTGNAGKTCIASIIGYALGKNNQLSNAYTLAYKKLNGLVATNHFSDSDLSTLLAANGNIYITQGYYYNLFRQGKMSNGDNFDEILYIDMLVDGIKNSLISLLIDSPKIPQTEEGIGILTSAMVDVLEDYKNINFIAPGVWTGSTVMALENGDTLGNGYLVQFESISSQSSANRANRIAPPCYVCIKLAGAIEHIVISLVANK